jgi:5'-methylthioadenosine phosphorylase
MEQIVDVLTSNASKARLLVSAVISKISTHTHESNCKCGRSLEHALVTASDKRDQVLLKKLDAVAGRVLRK